MTTLKILKAAHDLLAVPGTWIQCREALDKNGFSTLPDAEDATCWCALGAIRRVQGGTTPYAQVLLRLITSMPHKPKGDRLADIVLDWNDQPGRTQDEVLALFDKAIAAEESQQ